MKQAAHKYGGGIDMKPVEKEPFPLPMLLVETPNRIRYYKEKIHALIKKQAARVVSGQTTFFDEELT